MKLLLRVLLLGIVSCGLAHAADLTASELAQHLGVNTWRIPAGKLPGSFTAYLQQVKDGKPTPDGMSSGFVFHGKGDLVICAHEEAGKLIITMAQADNIWWPYNTAGIALSPFEINHSIEGQPAMGNHLLLADYPLVKDAKYPSGRKVATGQSQDVTRGLVLVIAN